MADEVTRAIADDTNDPVVHIADALLKMARGTNEEALEAVDRARDLSPRLFWVYLVSSSIHLERGALEEAMVAARECHRLAPYLPAARGRLIDVFLAAGRYDDAMAASERLME